MSLKRLALLLGIMLILGILVGCVGKEGDSSQQPPGSEQVRVDTPGVVEDEQAKVEQEQEAAAPVPSTNEKIEVVLYFGNKEGYLEPVKREIPKVQGIAKAAMLELIKGPGASSGLQPTIPQGTALRSVSIKENGLAVVDFSSQLKSRHWGGSTGESLTVYSIVNTLTQFPSIKEVQILVEGQKPETLSGHIALDRPLTRNSSIIQVSGN
ncbi:GerMN domain-containing protein [Desulfolucanica intricata]|uniref:GerMN domain-containing protein n=1 Tax=Desulfolucanica intricata TaxID=1285191 RepID=UPI000832CA4A|nr:GerMN domain-containing protein [Desulfolucanica intricata]